MLVKQKKAFSLLEINFRKTFFFQRVNITSFKECDIDPSANKEHFVTFTDIIYEYNADGLCDTVHAKYNIPTINDNDKLVRLTWIIINFSFTTKAL